MRQRTPLITVAIAIILWVIGSYAATADRGKPTLAGFWYGHDFQPVVGELVQRITNQKPDGTFTVEFRLYENCQLVARQVESGTWTLQSGVETKVTTKVAGEDAAYTDTYEILELTDAVLKKLHHQSNTIFTSERVSADFVFPECESFT